MIPEIQLRSGQYFNFDRPEDCKIQIEDIAHALGNICRFGGHCRQFYSVAQHSVYCSRYVPPGFELEALLHDAGEAFYGDVCTPLKRRLPEFQALMHRVDTVVHAALGIPLRMSPEVQDVDLRMLAAEREQLMPKTGKAWEVLSGVTPVSLFIENWDAAMARDYFMVRFRYLTRKQPIAGV